MKNKISIGLIFSLVFIATGLSIIIYSKQKDHFSHISDTSSPDFTGSSSKNKVILNYYIWDDEESYITSVIDTYRALHSSVQIYLHIIDSDSYDTSIKQLLASDKKIDLLSIRGLSKMIQFIDQGELLDLTSYIKNNDMDIAAYGSMFNDIDINGRYFGIPTRSTCWVLCYNKDIFDKAGIPYPEQLTWEEYRQLAISLTSEKGKNKTYGGYWVPWCYNFAALERSSYLIDDDLSLSRKSLELLNTFYNVDSSHMSYKVLTNEKIDYRKEFEKGKIAMMPQGEWIVNMLLQDEKKGLTDISWDIAPIPVWKSQESGITWGQYQFVSIASDTPYPGEAFDFVQFLCGEEGARIYAEKGIIHAYSNEDIKQIYLKTVGKESASIFFNAKKVQEEPAVSGYQDLIEAFNQCAESYFLGNITIDEAMTEFEQKRSDILKTN